MSIGIVVPGVSSTVILMCLGVYSHYLNAVATVNLAILFPMGIGVLLGSILFLKIIYTYVSLLLQHVRGCLNVNKNRFLKNKSFCFKDYTHQSFKQQLPSSVSFTTQQIVGKH